MLFIDNECIGCVSRIGPKDVFVFKDEEIDVSFFCLSKKMLRQ